MNNAARNLNGADRAKHLGLRSSSSSGVHIIDTAALGDAHLASIHVLATARANRAERRCMALNAALESHGWTPSKLANVMGVARQLVGKYCRNECGFSDEQVLAKMGSLGPVFFEKLGGGK